LVDATESASIYRVSRVEAPREAGADGSLIDLLLVAAVDSAGRRRRINDGEWIFIVTGGYHRGKE
jgi:hypothetical protein